MGDTHCGLEPVEFRNVNSDKCGMFTFRARLFVVAHRGAAGHAHAHAPVRCSQCASHAMVQEALHAVECGREARLLVATQVRVPTPGTCFQVFRTREAHDIKKEKNEQVLI